MVTKEAVREGSRPSAGVSASPPPTPHPPPPAPGSACPASTHHPPPPPQRRLGSRPSSAEQTCEASAGPSPAPCWSLACPLINRNPKAQFAPTPPGCQDRKWRQDGGEQTAPLPCPNPARPAPTRRDGRAGRPCLSARPEPRGPIPKPPRHGEPGLGLTWRRGWRLGGSAARHSASLQPLTLLLFLTGELGL